MKKVVLGLLLASTHLATTADTILQTSTIETFAFPQTYDTNYLFGGVEMFDESLGTLESVTLEFTLAFSGTLSVNGLEVIDESQPHSITFFEPYATFAVGFPFGSGVGYGLHQGGYSDIYEGSCTGEAGEPICSDNIKFNYDIETSTSETQSNLDYYIGTGNRNLFLTFFATEVMFGGEEGSLIDNVDVGNYEVNGFLDTTATLDVTYEYSPSVVPVPAAAWLFGSALIGLAGIKRRK